MHYYNDMIFAIHHKYDCFRTRDKRMVGFQGHVGGVQSLMINDLDLVRRVLIDDFDHFVDRWERVRYGNEKLNHMMHVVTGERWKELRHAVAPVFTSGKLRKAKSGSPLYYLWFMPDINFTGT